MSSTKLSRSFARVAALTLPLCLLVATSATGCAHRRPLPGPHAMSLTAETATPLVTLVWVGRGATERFEDGVWRRRPEFDYEFSVEQRRFSDHWDSVKTMRRRHPAYNGSAGPRIQTYLFRLDLAATADGAAYQVTSTIGDGAGRGDREFREAVLDLRADVSWFAPFDRYRITQHYQYEQGRLTELVELNDGASPWVRNHEEATLFSASMFPAPPTALTAPAHGAARADAADAAVSR